MGLSVQMINVCRSIYLSKNEQHEFLDLADGISMSSVSGKDRRVPTFSLCAPGREPSGGGNDKLPNICLTEWTSMS